MVCDLWETYQVTDWRALPARTLATLVAGLRDDSRLAQAERSIKGSHDTILLAAIADGVSAVLYSLAGGKGKRPDSLLALLDDSKADETKKIQSFHSAEAFERARARIVKRANNEHIDR